MSKINQYFILEPAKFCLDGGAMYGIIPKPLWEQKSKPDKKNRINLALRLLLIKTKNRNILIDTGIGDYHGEKFESLFCIRSEKSPLSNALNQCDVSPDEITDLIISHLHFDHVGGICELSKDKKLTPVFKNATIHLHKDHYSYALTPTKRDAGSFQKQYFQPIIEFYIAKKKVHWLENKSGDIIPDINIKYKSSNGHTPHLIHPYNDDFIYLTDLVPTSNHIKIPWVMGYDIEPGVTVQFKEEFLKFIHDKKLTIIYEHDDDFWGSKLELNQKGQFQPTELKDKVNQLSYEITFP
ncbi:MAG: MBL fold metallo-hydrolase [Bacteriovoracaceae bacterium]|nr:MBL fold metallo-hydrolase [Bacteriovoracaceae bacterium]